MSEEHRNWKAECERIENTILARLTEAEAIIAVFFRWQASIPILLPEGLSDRVEALLGEGRIAEIITLAEQDARRGMKERQPMKCDHCDNHATCHGTYEGHTKYACDACCGHGCEDGNCVPLNDHVAVSSDGTIYYNPEGMRHGSEEWEAAMKKLDDEGVPRRDVSGPFSLCRRC